MFKKKVAKKKTSKRKIKKSNPIKLKKNWLSKDSEISQLGLNRDGYVCTECGAMAWRPDKIPHKKGCPPESHYLVEDDRKDFLGRSIDKRIEEDFSGGQRPRFTNNYRRGW